MKTQVHFSGATLLRPTLMLGRCVRIYGNRRILSLHEIFVSISDSCSTKGRSTFVALVPQDMHAPGKIPDQSLHHRTVHNYADYRRNRFIQFLYVLFSKDRAIDFPIMHNCDVLATGSRDQKTQLHPELNFCTCGIPHVTRQVGASRSKYFGR